MISFKSNMQVAHALLSVVNTRLDDEIDVSRFRIEAYSNGREQGYHLVGSKGPENIAISFSENRNSDNIVIYIGKSIDFSMQGNVPNDEVYALATYFKCGEYQKAADFIVGAMKIFLSSVA